VHPINSAFDWWYFDVVSNNPNAQSSMVVTFFAGSQLAFPLLDPSDSITVARIWVSFPNGTLWETASNADGATVEADDNSSSSVWHKTGFSWARTRGSSYLINIDAPEAGVKGTIIFPSVSDMSSCLSAADT
jgi:hypothetical protein